MSKQHIYERLRDGIVRFTDERFVDNIKLRNHNITHHKNIRFERCVFENELSFVNINLPIHILFYDCEFSDVKFDECNIGAIKITDPIKISSININQSNLQSVYIRSKNSLEGDITIQHTKVHHELDLSRIKKLKGDVYLAINLDYTVEVPSLTTLLINSTFENLRIHGQLGGCSFDGITVEKVAYFDNIVASCIYLNKATIKENAIFRHCEVSSTVEINSLNLLNQSDIEFQFCTFKKNFFLSNSFFNKVKIFDTVFEGRASFSNLKTNYMN